MATELLNQGFSPSGALWRLLEVDAVRRVWTDTPLERPVLELGCGDGTFTRLALGHVETAIDIEPSAVERARQADGVYGRVLCQDARSLTEAQDYGTVLANCVLEHIAGVEDVLAGCMRALKPGGHLVATVPLVAMNDHLLVHSARYAEGRRRQLIHHNLWSSDDWVAKLRVAGFQKTVVIPYLSGELCSLWDSLDAPTWLGVGRYRVGKFLRYKAQLPKPARQRLDAYVGRLLVNAARKRRENGPPCATLLLATK
ncbi:MAG: class I SAM-dependent methyltransferase [Candidatus Dormibacteraeota bacterium]|uniref:Class I SAM-dependent methyltransferase n=1 Tax=Candidatus Aeolococcus gillhamiae TaxID=3127015 RepID=A0A934N7B3_9BACT|nr:class I SAM-dependent methyltransferase [Candidatus Dormibacteraeota bacterium]